MRTEFPNMSGMAVSSAVARGIAQKSESTEGKFSHSLASATAQVNASVREPVATSRDAQTPSVSTTSEASSRTSPAATNPFAAETRQVLDVGGDSEWAVYFSTHAPGEWASNPAARTKFVETYSEAALVTLDWTGTVPANMDLNWVTSCPVDSTGKPLPRVPSTELT